MNSTFRHAAALLAVCRLMSAALGTQTPEALVRVMPALRGPDFVDDDKREETVVHLVGKVGRWMNIPLYAISYDKNWSPAIVRPGGNPYELATCCLPS